MDRVVSSFVFATSAVATSVSLTSALSLAARLASRPRLPSAHIAAIVGAAAAPKMVTSGTMEFNSRIMPFTIFHKF
jgi:hypothetical protein